MAVLRIITIVLLVFDVLLLFGFFFAFFNAWALRPGVMVRVRRTREKRVLTLRDAVFRERWGAVAVRIEQGGQESLKLALIEADKLADDALKQLGLQGEHMADRMGQLSEGDIASLGRLWRAHRLRNDVVHTPGFEITVAQAKNALQSYEAFFKEIGVL